MPLISGGIESLRLVYFFRYVRCWHDPPSLYDQDGLPFTPDKMSQVSLLYVIVITSTIYNYIVL